MPITELRYKQKQNASSDTVQTKPHTISTLRNKFWISVCIVVNFVGLGAEYQTS